MTANEVEKIKREACSGGIYKAISDKLWSARGALENAPKGVRDVTFEENLKNAEDLIRDARQLHQEFLQYQTPK